MDSAAGCRPRRTKRCNAVHHHHLTPAGNTDTRSLSGNPDGGTRTRPLRLALQSPLSADERVVFTTASLVSAIQSQPGNKVRSPGSARALLLSYGLATGGTRTHDLVSGSEGTASFTTGWFCMAVITSPLQLVCPQSRVSRGTSGTEPRRSTTKLQAHSVGPDGIRTRASRVAGEVSVTFTTGWLWMEVSYRHRDPSFWEVGRFV